MSFKENMNKCERWNMSHGGLNPSACRLKEGCVFSPALQKCAPELITCSALDGLSNKEIVEIMDVLKFDSPVCRMAVQQKPPGRLSTTVQQLSEWWGSWDNKHNSAGNLPMKQVLCDCLSRQYPNLGESSLRILLFSVRNILLKYIDREFLSWFKSSYFVYHTVRFRLTDEKRLMLEFLVSRGEVADADKLKLIARMSKTRIKSTFFSDQRAEELKIYRKCVKTDFSKSFRNLSSFLHVGLKGVKLFSITGFIKSVKTKVPQLYEVSRVEGNATAIAQTANIVASRTSLHKSTRMLRLVLPQFLNPRGIKSKRVFVKEMVSCLSAYILFMDVIKTLRNAQRTLNTHHRIREIKAKKAKRGVFSWNRV
jgi:hypothetical protein